MWPFGKKPAARPRRRGLLKQDFMTSSIFFREPRRLDAVVEVEEIERAGSMSRINIISVSGVPTDIKARAATLVGEWVETSRVEWILEKHPLYVRMKPPGSAVDQKVIDAPNGTVVIDYDKSGEILGVEVLDGWVE